MKFEGKKFVWATAIALFFNVSVRAQEGPGSGDSGNPNFRPQQERRNGGGKVDKSGDTVLQALLAETVSKFAQFEYTDSETGERMAYNFFIPEGYDASRSYPLLMFIGDASTAKREILVPLTQGYGGVIWASEAEQRKHPCFILVPQYTTVTVGDNFSTSFEVELTIRLLKSICDTYSIDRNRLYTTGQSMGGMMSLYFNIAHPDLFAASLFVGCQWDTSKMGHFPREKFFYVVGAGDPKASKGMAELKEVLRSQNSSMCEDEWSARLPQAEQEARVEAMVKKGQNNNFIVFEKGTVLPESGQGMEHMYSFDFAYKLEGVRDWLFRQSK